MMREEGEGDYELRFWAMTKKSLDLPIRFLSRGKDLDPAIHIHL